MTIRTADDLYYDPWGRGPRRNALARIEGRIALDEIMNRFPDWDVDLDAAVFSSSSAVRGWDSMPAHV